MMRHPYQDENDAFAGLQSGPMSPFGSAFAVRRRHSARPGWTWQDDAGHDSTLLRLARPPARPADRARSRPVRRRSLFDRIARAVCAAECLPRKELYEAWEMARRVRRVSAAAASSTSAAATACSRTSCCFDDTSPARSWSIRRWRPRTSVCTRHFFALWPRLAGRVAFVERGIESVGRPATSSCPATAAGGSPTPPSTWPSARGRASRSCRAATTTSTAKPASWPAGCRPIWRSTRRGPRDSAGSGIASGRSDSGRGHAAQPAADRGADGRGVGIRALQARRFVAGYFAASTFLTMYSLVPHSPVALTVISSPAALTLASCVITAASSATS